MRKKCVKTKGKIYASAEKPFIVCRTCGLATDKVIVRVSDSLRHIPNRTPHRFKSWKRTVKYSEKYKSEYQGRECKGKIIFFSYTMMNCIKKKHKLSIRKKPFSTKLAKTIR